MKHIPMRDWRILALLTALLLSLSLPAAADFWSRLRNITGQGPVAGATTVTYTPDNWPTPLQGDLYLPRDTSAQAPYPVVVLLHGGGWNHGDKGSENSLGQKLAQSGYASLAINYRLAPDAHYPAQLEDVQQALRWLQQNADKYHLDMNRLATWGYSAGGHLATLVAMQPATDLPEVKAVVAGGVPADLTASPAPDSSSVQAFLGGSQQDIPATYQQASPMTYVHSGLPPFFLFHGTADQLVPPDQAKAFAAALQQAGVPVQLEWVQGATHETASASKDVRAKALDFLDSHLKQAAGSASPSANPGTNPDSAPATPAGQSGAGDSAPGSATGGGADNSGSEATVPATP